MEQATAKVVESVNQKVSDFRESALREKNIIMHGADEAEGGLDRRTEDTEFVSNFLNSLIQTPLVSRLGPRKKNTNDNVETEVKLPRPKRVTMSDVDTKRTVIKKLSKLRDVEETNAYKKLSFKHDMSKSEREANKEKLAEAERLSDKEK